jgi:hypothetical protein
MISLSGLYIPSFEPGAVVPMGYLGSRLQQRDIIDQLKVGGAEHFDASFHGPPRVSSEDQPNHLMQAERWMPKSTALSAA